MQGNPDRWLALATHASASFEKTIENLGADPKDPFIIFPEVKDYYNEIL